MPSVPQRQRLVEAAERERPRAYEDEEEWKVQWVSKQKQVMEGNRLNRYAMSEEKRPRSGMDGRGRAF